MIFLLRYGRMKFRMEGFLGHRAEKEKIQEKFPKDPGGIQPKKAGHFGSVFWREPWRFCW